MPPAADAVDDVRLFAEPPIDASEADDEINALGDYTDAPSNGNYIICLIGADHVAR